MKIYKCDGCGEQVCVEGSLDNNDTCEVMYELHAVYRLISSKTVNKGTREGHLFCNNCIEKLIPKKDEESFKLMEPAEISKNSKNLIRYRFRTKSVEDFRPLIDLATIKMPYWCTGYGVNGDFENANAIIVCYLPKTEDLFKYWDDAYDIEKEECDEIIYTDRFPKPDWCN